MLSFKSSLIVAMVMACGSSKASNRGTSPRRLSFQLIAGYQPLTLITDLNAIDLDQAEFERQLVAKNFSNAKAIYQEGAYSNSYANITLEIPARLRRKALKGDPVIGYSQNGALVRGKLMETFETGSSFITVEYNVTGVQQSYVTCQVGALTRLAKANRVGCFAVSSNITIESEIPQNYTYSYDVHKDNKNGRTLQLLSTNTTCDGGCAHDTLQTFFDYYGNASYGDVWVRDAFSRTSTRFLKGNANFTALTGDGISEVIQKGTVVLNVWMYVVSAMEAALSVCEEGCPSGCTEDVVNSWDMAVALYTGSLEGTDGSGKGVLLYDLADKRCVDFKTCGENADQYAGTSNVNIQIFKHFAQGQQNLLQGMCSEAIENKKRIRELMTVPLIQGTLRYAYLRETNTSVGEKGEAEGATFAAAVLPLVAKCDAQAAQMIYDNMRLGSTVPTYSKVNNAFQVTYSCLGITCEEISGFFDSGSQGYYAGVNPCSQMDTDHKNTAGIAVGVSILVISAIFLGTFFFVRYRKRKSLEGGDIPPTFTEVTETTMA